MPRLVPLPRRRSDPAPSGAERAPAPEAPPAEDAFVLFELHIARTADLLLKVAGLLDREVGRADRPGRAGRITRLAWAAEHAQRALLDAAGSSRPRPAEAPRPTGSIGLRD